MRLPSIQTLALLLILALIFLLRIPSLFEPNWYGDEGIFAAVAQGLLKGQPLYTGTWDNKPPLIYLLYAAIFKIFGTDQFFLRLFASFSVLTSAFFIFKIAQKTLGVKRALSATALFGILASSLVMEANLALTEIFMILPQAAAFWIFFSLLGAKKPKMIWYPLAGSLLGLGFLLKQVGGLEAAVFGLLVLVTQNNQIRKAFLFSVGFLIPFGLTCSYFLAKGGTTQLNEFIFASYTYYRIYIGESPVYGPLFTTLKFVPFIFSLAWVGKQRLAKKPISPIQIFSLWFGASLIGSLFSGRPYGHYLIEITPAASLLLASAKKPQPGGGLLVILGGVVIPSLILVWSAFRVFVAPSDPLRFGYYKNFFAYLMGQMAQEKYNDSFDRNVNEIHDLATFLKREDLSGDWVYIWGDFSWTYALADLKNPSRYVTSFHVFGVPGGREEVIKDLNEKKPKIIIKTENNIGQFDHLEEILDRNYVQGWLIGGSKVYEKK